MLTLIYTGFFEKSIRGGGGGSAPPHPVISGCILPRRIKNESKNIKRCIFVSRFQIYFSFFGETTREKVLLFKTTFY